MNEALVEPLPWGHHAGCEFVEQPCSQWKRPRYICTAGGREECSYDRRGMAYCDITNFADPLPPEHQYFGSPHRGGYSELFDHCPVYRSYSNGDCTDDSGFASAWLPQGGQERCAQCRCFESNSNTYFSQQPSCFRMRCLNSTRLEVRVGGRWHKVSLWQPSPPSSHPSRSSRSARSSTCRETAAACRVFLLTHACPSRPVPPSWPCAAPPACPSALDATHLHPRQCPSGGGTIYLQPLNDDAAGEINCPPSSELCDADYALWPNLSSIEPTSGPASGGIRLTLHGNHLDSLRPPVTLLFGTDEGTETKALDLQLVSSTLATAVLPRLHGATAFSRADVTLTDQSGRTAYLFQVSRPVQPQPDPAQSWLLRYCHRPCSPRPGV